MKDKVTVVAIFQFISIYVEARLGEWRRRSSSLYALYDYLRSRMYYDILIKQ